MIKKNIGLQWDLPRQASYLHAIRSLVAKEAYVRIILTRVKFTTKKLRKYAWGTRYFLGYVSFIPGYLGDWNAAAHSVDGDIF